MAQDRALIQIPESNASISPTPFEKATENRFNKIDNILIAVVASVIISGIAVVIAVIGLFIDQLRYNNAAYQDYSDRLGERNKLLQEYKKQLEENNRLLKKIEISKEQ